jgi:hypothetical protein
LQATFKEYDSGPELDDCTFFYGTGQPQRMPADQAARVSAAALTD